MDLKEKIVIAIDGFSSCGKSTFAKLIAKELSYIFIDTGAMYRAVSLYALRNKLVKEGTIDSNVLVEHLSEIEIHFERTPDKVCTFLNGENIEENIRGVEVSHIVSEVSKIKKVRQYLVDLQQDMGNNKGIVMDGRDIGTVVFPSAEVKIYMTASSDIRAKRRYDELIEKGLEVSFDDIKHNIEDRDYNDLNRSESPLMRADDALELDNSQMTINSQMVWFKELLGKKGLLK